MIPAIEAFLKRIIVFIACLQGLAIVILIGVEVFFRYIVGRALSWPEEVIGLIFVWFTLLGVVLLTHSGEHIEFSFLLSRFGPRVGKGFAIFIQASISLFAVLMIIYGYSYASMFQFERTPAVGINALWLNLSLPIGGLLILLCAQLNILKIFRPPEKEKRMS